MVHASLFSGIGAADLAATWMGWDNAFTCEVDDFCNHILDHHFPDAEHYGDIKAADFTKWKGKVDVLTGGFPCFAAGTPVLTDMGYKPIERVRVGDMVLTADGTFHPVEVTMEHYADMMTSIRVMGIPEPIRCTPNHKMITVQNIMSKWKMFKKKVMQASELEHGDLLPFILHEGDTGGDTALWKVAGLWLACGSFTEDGDVAFMLLDRKFKEGMEALEAAGYDPFIIDINVSRIKRHVHVRDEALRVFLENLTGEDGRKRPYKACHNLSDECKAALTEGMGIVGRDLPGYKRGIIVNDMITAAEMAAIARDARGDAAHICHIGTGKASYPFLRLPNGRTSHERDGMLTWVNIRGVETVKTDKYKVYNLTVKDEHTYNVWGIAVSNCQPFSTAGNRKGADDDRYLWPEYLRVIREIRPSWVIGENVAGIMSMVERPIDTTVGRQADLFGEGDGDIITERRERYTASRIIDDLEREGYEVQPFIIPACAVGAPHIRNRIFFVAHADSEVLPPQVQDRHDDRGRRRELRGDEEERQGGSDDPAGLHRVGEAPQGDAADATDLLGAHGVQRRQGDAEGDTLSQEEQVEPRGGSGAGDSERDDPSARWRAFPSESPICGGDDGFPEGMGRCSIPSNRWRERSLSAYGNAIVPQVIYEIFRAIQIAENEKNDKTGNEND